MHLSPVQHVCVVCTYVYVHRAVECVASRERLYRHSLGTPFSFSAYIFLVLKDSQSCNRKVALASVKLTNC